MPDIFRDVALENLDSSEHLDHLMEVTTPGRWLLVLGFGLAFLALFWWGFQGNVRRFAEGEGWILDPGNEGSAASARIFVPEHMGTNLQQGLPVWLEPANFPAEHFGYLLGEVASIQRIPANERTNHEALAATGSTIQIGTDVFDVRIDLKRTESGSVGVWTLAGSNGKVPLAKTPVTAKVIIAEQRPVDFLWNRKMGREE